MPHCAHRYPWSSTGTLCLAVIHSVVPIRDSDLKYSNLSPYRQSCALTHDDCWVYRKMGAAIAALRSDPSFKGKVGAIGYCMGGRLAFLAGARLGIDAAICYYPTRLENFLDEANSVRCPIMFHFGGKDGAVPPESREKI